MIREDFRKLPNFTYQEMLDHYTSKGHSVFNAKLQISKVKPALMKTLQKLRTKIGRPIYFNCLTEGSHVPKSLHYNGNAADIRIGGKGAKNWNHILQCAIEVGFKGIGFYPNWNTPGFHVDVRHSDFKCWKRIKVNGRKVYRGLI